MVRNHSRKHVAVDFLQNQVKAEQKSQPFVFEFVLRLFHELIVHVVGELFAEGGYPQEPLFELRVDLKGNFVYLLVSAFSQSEGRRPVADCFEVLFDFASCELLTEDIAIKVFEQRFRRLIRSFLNVLEESLEQELVVLFSATALGTVLHSPELKQHDFRVACY